MSLYQKSLTNVQCIYSRILKYHGKVIYFGYNEDEYLVLLSDDCDALPYVYTYELRSGDD